MKKREQTFVRLSTFLYPSNSDDPGGFLSLNFFAMKQGIQAISILSRSVVKSPGNIVLPNEERSMTSIP